MIRVSIDPRMHERQLTYDELHETAHMYTGKQLTKLQNDWRKGWLARKGVYSSILSVAFVAAKETLPESSSSR